MYFTHTYNTLWHDAGPSGVLRPSALLRYMQETGNRQCRAFGYDLDTMFREDHMGFILARLRMRVLTPLRPYGDIEVRTWCPPSRGVTFLRCFSILQDGVTAAKAMSYWALVDAENKRFLRVTEFDRPFPDGEALPEDDLPLIARLSPAIASGMEQVGSRTVAFSDIDFNRHMNNTRYPDVACDALPAEALDGRYVSELSVSFLKEAPLGETLSVFRAADAEAAGQWLVRGIRSDGQTCFDAVVKTSEMN